MMIDIHVSPRVLSRLRRFAVQYNNLRKRFKLYAGQVIVDALEHEDGHAGRAERIITANPPTIVAIQKLPSRNGVPAALQPCFSIAGVLRAVWPSSFEPGTGRQPPADGERHLGRPGTACIFSHGLGCCGGTSGGTSATSGGATGTSGAGGTYAEGEVFLGRFRVTRHDICDVVVRTDELVHRSPSLPRTIPAAIATRCPLRARLNRGSLLRLRP